MFAQQPLSLEDAVKKALRNNYEIRIARQNAEIAKTIIAGEWPADILYLAWAQVSQPFDNSPNRTGAGGRDNIIQIL